MSDAEQRQVLERIARDEDVHPRDRIAAVRALMAIARAAGETIEDELDRIMVK